MQARTIALLAVLSASCTFTNLKVWTPLGTVEAEQAGIGDKVGTDIADIARAVNEAPAPVRDNIIKRACDVCQSWRDIREAYLQGLASGAFPEASRPSMQALVNMYSQMIKRCDDAVKLVQAMGCPGPASDPGTGEPPRENDGETPPPE